MSKRQKTPAEKVKDVTNTIAKLGAGDLDNSSMFHDTGTDLGEDMVIASRSPLLKPAQFPIGKALIGIIRGIKGLEVSKNKYGPCIEISPEGKGVGVLLPATAMIAGALEITVEDEKKGIFKCPFVNYKVRIEKLPDRLASKKGQDAWNFIIARSEKPVMV